MRIGLAVDSWLVAAAWNGPQSCRGLHMDLAPAACRRWDTSLDLDEVDQSSGAAEPGSIGSARLADIRSHIGAVQCLGSSLPHALGVMQRKGSALFS